MSFNWSRRVLLAAAVASLAACGGGGDVESQLQPARIVAFGDGFADVGQNGSRYTVNNGSINIWTQQVAARYGLALTPSSAGGKSYATGNARVNTRPDAAGNNATPTVKEQVDSFLASDKFGATDMVIINAGVSDVIAETAKFAAGAQTQAALQANLKTAGAALATQVRRLVDNGARYVIVVGSYNMGKSPWGNQVPAMWMLPAASAMCWWRLPITPMQRACVRPSRRSLTGRRATSEPASPSPGRLDWLCGRRTDHRQLRAAGLADLSHPGCVGDLAGHVQRFRGGRGAVAGLWPGAGRLADRGGQCHHAGPGAGHPGHEAALSLNLARLLDRRRRVAFATHHGKTRGPGHAQKQAPALG